MAPERECPALRWPLRRWCHWSTVRFLNCPWTEMSCLSSICLCAILQLCLCITSTSTKPCGGTHLHTHLHTPLWWVTSQGLKWNSTEAFNPFSFFLFFSQNEFPFFFFSQNFHLIDYNMLVFTVIVLARRLIAAIVKEVMCIIFYLCMSF